MNNTFTQGNFESTGYWGQPAKLLLLSFFFMLLWNNGWGQVSNYTFSQSAGTYSAITGGTVYNSGTGGSYIGGSGVTNWTNLNPGFNIVFNGVSYNRFSIVKNGYIVMGNSAGTIITSPISNSLGANNVISAFGWGLEAINTNSNSNVRWQVTGSSPNRVLTVQWTQFRSSSTNADVLNFQLKVFEGSNIVQTVYGTCTPTSGTATLFPQVGLRGSTNADFNSRNMASDPNAAWLNNTTASTSNSGSPYFKGNTRPASGTTYTWTPPAACTSPTITANPNSSAASTCLNGTAFTALSVTASGTATLSYQWQSSPVSNFSNSIVNVGTNNSSFTPPNNVAGTLYYRCIVTNDCGNATSNVSGARTVSTPPTAPTSVTSSLGNTICNGQTTTLSFGGGDDGSGATYEWFAGSCGSTVLGTGTTLNVSPSSSTTYYVRRVGTSPCNSTTTDCASLLITVTPPTTVTTTETACGSYTWAVNGTTYTEGGTYSVVNGCQTQELVLTITPPTTVTTTENACDSYAWAVNGTTYTESGTYSVLNGCETQELVLTITTPTSVTTTESACGSYTWAANGTTYTESDTYTVQNGCETQELVLTITPPTTVTTTETACDSYAWAVNGTTYTESDTYTVQNGCETQELVLTVNPSPEPSIVDVNGVLSTQDYASVQWSLDGVPIDGATGQTYVPTAAGAYTVAVTDNAGCDGVSAPFDLLPVSVQSLGSGMLTIMPNPTSGMLFIQGLEGDTEVEVLTVDGRLLLRAETRSAWLDLTHVSPGTYLLRIKGTMTRFVRF
jgi:hypothetical protein